MSIRKSFFVKESRRSSVDLTTNLYHVIGKLTKDKPVRLSQVKVEYDRYFKDKISVKNPDTILAVLKTLEENIVSVKVYVQVGNREMTDILIGLRTAEYSSQMFHEDNPLISKERLLQIIKDQESLGIYVRDLEERYISFYGTRPSYLPFKSIKELLHRNSEVELASSGKHLRVRSRQNPIPQRRSMTRIPSLTKSSAKSYCNPKKMERDDLMSRSMYRPSDMTTRVECDMSRSVYVPHPSSLEDSSAPSSSSGSSPNGSIDMSVSMILPKTGPKIFNSEMVPRKRLDKDDILKQNKEIMATIINDLPPEGVPLKALSQDFANISGRDLHLGMTTVEFLVKEFNHVVKIVDHENEMRVFKTNSPLLPRRTIADVYTKLALQSNRRPSDRVLKILKDFYKKRDPDSVEKAIPPLVVEDLPQSSSDPLEQDILENGPNQVQTVPVIVSETVPETASKCVPVQADLSPQKPRITPEVIETLKQHLALKPVEYPLEFEKIVGENAQSLLLEYMSQLNLCLQPCNGRMVLIYSLA